MGGPQRMPKTKEEREYDKMMRGRRPSVWEDKGSVGDARFRSLKGAAKLHQDHLGAGSLLPPLAGSISEKEQGGADGTHGAGAVAVPPGAAQRAPRRHGAADFDGFMRGTNKKAHKEHTHVRSFSVPPMLDGGASGMNPHHIHKLLAKETPKWLSLTANECGRAFGERNSAAMGANLFRHEHEASMQQKMRTVDAVLRAYGGEGSDALAASLEASRSMLPLLNPRGSRLKMGAGYIKVDLLAEDAGIYPLRGVHKPVRMRDAGGISPPVKHKARRAKDASDAEEFRQLKALYATTSERIIKDQALKEEHVKAQKAHACTHGLIAT